MWRMDLEGGMNWEISTDTATLSCVKQIVKAMTFSVAMYRCESWTIKEAECQRIDVVELWYWKRCFSHWDRKKIKPVKRKSTLNIHWKDWCWSSNTLCEELTHWERYLMLGKVEAKGGGGCRVCFDSITYSMDMNLSKLWETVEDRGCWHAAVAESQTWLS